MSLEETIKGAKNRARNVFEGGIGYVTKGRLHLVDYYKQAVMTAMIHLENKEMY